MPEGVSTAACAEHRLALALGAYRIGYYLLDLVEVRTTAGSLSHRSDPAAWAGVERLAAGVGVDALVVRCHPAAVFPRALPDVLAHLSLRLVRGCPGTAGARHEAVEAPAPNRWGCPRATPSAAGPVRGDQVAVEGGLLSAGFWAFGRTGDPPVPLGCRWFAHADSSARRCPDRQG